MKSCATCTMSDFPSWESISVSFVFCKSHFRRIWHFLSRSVGYPISLINKSVPIEDEDKCPTLNRVVMQFSNKSLTTCQRLNIILFIDCKRLGTLKNIFHDTSIQIDYSVFGHNMMYGSEKKYICIGNC